MKQRGLGKGLSSLIPSKKNQIDIHQHPPLKRETVFYIETSKIKFNPSQPRQNFDEAGLEELANSILKHGILQPLVVSKIEKETELGKKVEYQLIAGERRLRAAKKIGMLEVPVIIKETDDKSRLEIALIENIQRKDLNPLEKAEAFEKLQRDYGFTHQKIAEQIGKSREYITNLLRLLSLPTDIKQAIRENKITEGHARAIISLKDPIKQKELFFQILNNKISVRDTEDLVKKHKKSIRPKILSPYLKELIDKLEDKLGTKVDLILKSKGGKIMIDFYSNEDLENIINKIF